MKLKVTLLSLFLVAGSSLAVVEESGDCDLYVNQIADTGNDADCYSEPGCGFQQALDIAKSDGVDTVVCVQSGTYNVTSTLSYVTTDGDGKLIVKAKDPSNKPVLDGGDSVRVMAIDNDSDNNGGDNGNDITIKNLIFQHGKSSIHGGGLYLRTADASATIDGCEFKNNEASMSGGGVFAVGTLTFSNNIFNENHADIGGGVVADGTSTFTDNTFNSNSSNGQGGGVYALGTSTFTNNTFSGNSAKFGGGIYAYGTSTFTNNIFNSNSSHSQGGGVSAGGTSIFTNNTFSGNTSGNRGGGVLANGTSIFTNNIFNGNYGHYNGGGVYVDGTSTFTNNTFSKNSSNNGGGVYADGTLTFTNNTFSKNFAGVGGGLAIIVYNSYIYNNIFWENSAGFGDDIYWNSTCYHCNEINIYNNDFSCNDFDIDSDCLYGTYYTYYHHANNISANPLFVDPDNGDFHLQSTSPCINKGDNNAPSLPDTDFEGDPRIIGGVVDMGADEVSMIPVTNGKMYGSYTIGTYPNTAYVNSQIPCSDAPSAYTFFEMNFVKNGMYNFVTAYRDTAFCYDHPAVDPMKPNVDFDSIKATLEGTMNYYTPVIIKIEEIDVGEPGAGKDYVRITVTDKNTNTMIFGIVGIINSGSVYATPLY